jgi:hypothetical protein
MEPLRATVLRNGAITLVVGTVIALAWRRVDWITALLMALWPSFGGHFIEVGFLNWFRPRLSRGRNLQTAARLVVWFVGGVALSAGMTLTSHRHLWTWWVGGAAFIGIELVAHGGLFLRGQPNFYDGRG